MNDRQKVLELRATMAKQQDLIDSLESAEERLERENAELKAKIAELASQIEGLQMMLNDAGDAENNWHNDNSALSARSEQFIEALMASENLSKKSKELISGIWSCMPASAQCLAEIKAQAVEDFKGSYKLPCDVGLYPSTSVKKGVSIAALICAMEVRARGNES